MEEQFQQKRLNYNTRRRQQRASETEEEENENDRERRVKEKKRSLDGYGVGQNLSVLKRIKRAAESDGKKIS